MNAETVNDGFEEWVEAVRDPAAKASEGRRVLRAGKEAEAAYEVAPLPDGRWAVRVAYLYLCGNVSSRTAPWEAFASRDECLTHFLDGAREHFGDIGHIQTSAQRKAQQKMAELLAASLLFVEPKPEPPDPEVEEGGRQEKVRLDEQRVAVKKKLRADMPLFADILDAESA